MKNEMMVETIIKTEKCLNCGSEKFRQEVVEIYNKYLDNKSKIIEFEDELTHDFEFGKIRCVKCGEIVLEDNKKEVL